MKRTLFAVVISVAGLSVLMAGPEPVRDDKKAVVAPEQPMAPCNWTGFYIGGQVGYAFEGNAEIETELGGAWTSFRSPTDGEFITPFANRDLNGSGVVAGGFVGYNYQWHSFVFGAEASFDYVGLDDSLNTGLLTVNPGDGALIGDRHSYETNYLITIGPRVGYAVNRFLLYVTGGLALGDLKFSQTIVEPESGFIETGSSDNIQVGWTVGGGVQYCITEHWSARVEYRYTDLGCADFSTAANGEGDIFTGHHEACLTFHSVTAGLAYKF